MNIFNKRTFLGPIQAKVCPPLPIFGYLPFTIAVVPAN